MLTSTWTKPRARAPRSACAVRAIKESVHKGLRMPLSDALGAELFYAARVFSTEDAIEGPLAFAQKREPKWKGR